ncbi:hypothetical protein [Devosia sp.]|jgi:hypothetical protein|uniref:hypothetical protein n=1 Tax=Devosia sp. TaxID=1871048 RepID=UPI0037BFE303
MVSLSAAFWIGSSLLAGQVILAAVFAVGHVLFWQNHVLESLPPNRRGLKIAALPSAMTEAGYGKVQTDLVLLRRACQLPYHWLADNTRWQRKPAG